MKCLIDLKKIGLKNLITIMICGLILLVISVSEILSTNKQKEKEESVKIDNEITKESNEDYVNNLEKRLEEVLKNTKGVGEANVMITVESMSERVVLKDSPEDKENIAEYENDGSNRESASYKNEEETVIIEDSEGNMMPYVVKELEPTISGVVVIAQGADSPEVVNEINEAVQVLFDIPVHKIKVMKMNN